MAAESKSGGDAGRVANIIRSAFPDVPLTPGTPIGAVSRTQSPNGRTEYYLSSDPIEVEAFFHGLAPDALYGQTPAETQARQERHFASKRTPKRWCDVEGESLLTWLVVTSSLRAMSPPARAYYFPAYLLTALALAPESLSQPQPEGELPRVHPADFVGATVDALVPPAGLDPWRRTPTLPAVASDAALATSAGLSREEDFLRFVTHFNDAQRRAIREFVKYVLESLYADARGFEDTVSRLQRTWIEAQ